jgi:hypothetical protein
VVGQQYANAEGGGWSTPASITGRGTYVGAPAVAADASGRLHLLLTRRNAAQSLELLYWLWEEGAWSAEGSLQLGEAAGETVDYLAAAVSRTGQLMVTYPGSTTDAVTGEVVTAWYYSYRAVDGEYVPSVTATDPVQPSPSADVTSTAAPPTSSAATAAPTEAAVVVSTSPPESSSPWIGIALAGGLVTILMAGAFGYRLVSARWR